MITYVQKMCFLLIKLCRVQNRRRNLKVNNMFTFHLLEG